MIRIVSSLMLVVCLAAVPAGAQKLEKGVPVPDAIPAALKAVVQPQGVRVVNDAGPYAEIWLNKALAAEVKEGAGDLAYPGIPDGSFLGVWRYVAAGSDFRSQPVKPGFYSMRHALMPIDGNHVGASPYRDFVLLVPADADQNPAANLKYEEVVALSRKASGTNHPAVYPMLAPESVSDATLAKNDQGHSILKVKAPTKSGGGVPVAFVVIGRGGE